MQTSHGEVRAGYLKFPYFVAAIPVRTRGNDFSITSEEQYLEDLAKQFMGEWMG